MHGAQRLNGRRRRYVLHTAAISSPVNTNDTTSARLPTVLMGIATDAGVEAAAMSRK